MFLGVLENRSQLSRGGRHGLGIQLTEVITENGYGDTVRRKTVFFRQQCRQDDVAQGVTETNA